MNDEQLRKQVERDLERQLGPAPEPPKQHVVVTDFDMPFNRMVGFMVKWALASIPAFIILAVAGAFIFSLVVGGLAAQ